MEEPESRPTLGDWLWALARLRPLWPLPALIVLIALLPFLPAEAWQPQYTTRRTLSKAETAMLISGLSCVMYWLVLVLGRQGLTYTRRSWGMREPSEAELVLVEAGLRFMCLFTTYLGPVLLIWAR